MQFIDSSRSHSSRSEESRWRIVVLFVHEGGVTAVLPAAKSAAHQFPKYPMKVNGVWGLVL
jgi:hypothetical protein